MDRNSSNAIFYCGRCQTGASRHGASSLRYEYGHYNPRTEPEKEWVQDAMLRFLKLYRTDQLGGLLRQGTEMDFVMQCWSPIDSCFYNLAFVGRDHTCLSTLVHINSEKGSTRMKPVEEQHRACRPDFLVAKGGMEYAVGECGKEDVSRVGHKEIVERELHIPKVMMDVFFRGLSIGQNRISLARAMRRTVAISQRHLRMELRVLDSPAGYVCRVLKSNEYMIPESPTRIPRQLFPLTKLTLKAKKLIKNTINQIAQNEGADQDDDVNISTRRNERYWELRTSDAPKFLGSLVAHR